MTKSLTRRHFTFARNVLILDMPWHCNPKTAGDLMARNYVRVTRKGLYELTARGKLWLDAQTKLRTGAVPKPNWRKVAP